MAIKHPKTCGSDEMTVFLEEAKSMLEIEDYHENIINLQGIIYGMEDVAKGIPKVIHNSEFIVKLSSYTFK